MIECFVHPNIASSWKAYKRKKCISKRNRDYNTAYLVKSCRNWFIKNKVTFNYDQ